MFKSGRHSPARYGANNNNLDWSIRLHISEGDNLECAVFKQSHRNTQPSDAFRAWHSCLWRTQKCLYFQFKKKQLSSVRDFKFLFTQFTFVSFVYFSELTHHSFRANGRRAHEVHVTGMSRNAVSFGSSAPWTTRHDTVTWLTSGWIIEVRIQTGSYRMGRSGSTFRVKTATYLHSAAYGHCHLKHGHLFAVQPHDYQFVQHFTALRLAWPPNRCAFPWRGHSGLSFPSASKGNT
jgi:hypothetical protein